MSTNASSIFLIIDNQFITAYTFVYCGVSPTRGCTNPRNISYVYRSILARKFWLNPISMIPIAAISPVCDNEV